MLRCLRCMKRLFYTIFLMQNYFFVIETLTANRRNVDFVTEMKNISSFPCILRYIRNLVKYHLFANHNNLGYSG